MTIKELQTQVTEWATRNFPNAKPHQALLGIVEEIGELCHAHLKSEQGIRGTEEAHLAAKKDAIGDVFIFAMHYCAMTGLDAWEAMGNPESLRDFVRDDTDGKDQLPLSQPFEFLLRASREVGLLCESELYDTITLKRAQIKELMLNLCSYAHASGFDPELAVWMTWQQVKQRDWQKNKQNGGEA